MTTFLAAIASMLVLTALVWLVSRKSDAALCPVCIGVSGTWLALLAARLAGLQVDPTVLGILLGATALGVVQWQAERLPPGRSALLWKTLALATSFGAAYGLVSAQWLIAASGAAGLMLLAIWIRRPPKVHASSSETVTRLEERMKRCC